MANMPHNTGTSKRLGPQCPLPLPKEYDDVDEYLAALLAFVSSSHMMQLLCGGVHILDFFTQEPDLYSCLLPEAWRTWFDLHDLQDILDFLLREDIDLFRTNVEASWRGKAAPPGDLVEFVYQIRSLSLNRELATEEKAASTDIPLHTAVGMKVKKVHEVDNFARYIEKLTHEMAASGRQPVTHLVDFGSGQNYLGRTLASPPYSKHVIAVESRPHNIEGAKAMDIMAKLAPRVPVIVNKKQHRKDMEAAGIWKSKAQMRAETEAARASGAGGDVKIRQVKLVTRPKFSSRPKPELLGGVADTVTLESTTEGTLRAKLEHPNKGRGSIQYVEHRLEDGNLASVVEEITEEEEPSPVQQHNGDKNKKDPNLMVISIHSCGNLTHHGLRSLLLNPSVSAVAMIGCCYNLVSERLNPPSYKHPILAKSQNPDDKNNCSTGDPHGFPMSELLATYPTPTGRGITLNITARMMAVQAPTNWTPASSTAFFTRHFYRALLQRILLDFHAVCKPSSLSSSSSSAKTSPVIIGTLRKPCYASFPLYVRGALSKLARNSNDGAVFAAVDAALTDADIEHYLAAFAHRRK